MPAGKTGSSSKYLVLGMSSRVFRYLANVHHLSGYSIFVYNPLVLILIEAWSCELPGVAVKHFLALYVSKLFWPNPSTTTEAIPINFHYMR